MTAMTVKSKKIMNAPENIIPEMIEGMVGAHPDLLRVEGATGRAVVAVDGPRSGKVGVVVGGGSGHEPAFAGYVGRGLADAAAVGNVFASPSPEQILDAARAAGLRSGATTRAAARRCASCVSAPSTIRMPARRTCTSTPTASSRG